MRLIDADRLKEVFRRNTVCDYADIIDNAPTVCDLEQIYNEGRQAQKDIDNWKEVVNKATLEQIRAEITSYYLDCDFAEDNETCKQCTKNVFGSILRIIDRHTKGAEE